ncbi:MAG: pectate lyase-like adhesive domain-containing protein [Lachnospiraceae bacterium]
MRYIKKRKGLLLITCIILSFACVICASLIFTGMAEENMEHDVDEVTVDNSSVVSAPLQANEVSRLETTASVSTWDQFVAALGNTGVATIDVQANLTRPNNGSNPGSIARDLRINGNGYTIDFGSTGLNGIILNTPTAGSAALILNDVYLIKTYYPTTPILNQSSAAASNNWSITLENVRTGTGNMAGLITAQNATVTVCGTENNLSLNASAYHFYIKSFEIVQGAALKLTSAGLAYAALCITNGELNIRENAALNITNNGTFAGEGDFYTLYSSGIYGSITAMTMEGGSTLDIYADVGVGYRTNVSTNMNLSGGAIMNVKSRTQIAMSIAPNYGDAPATTSTLNISGTNTQLNVKNASILGEIMGPAMCVRGVNCIVNLKDGAILDVYSPTNTCVQFLGTGNIFNITNGAKMDLVQDNETYGLEATFRFRISGGQTLNIDNAEVNITKNGGYTTAVRLYGGDNAINVTNGGKLKVRNYGNGTIYDGYGDVGNQGIFYTATPDNKKNSFYVDGDNSEIDIQADYGPAIYANGTLSSSTIITASNQSIFKLTGVTASYNYGTLGCSGPINITLDNPQYFDIRNNRVGSGTTLGGYCLSSGSANSTFTTVNSDLSVWSRGSNLDGNSTRSWILFDYTLTGQYFQTISYTNIEDEFNTSTYGSTGAQGYSRMSANSVTAVVDELRVPTNADKYIYGHAYIPEGSGGIRDAWTDEVHVIVQVLNAEGTIVFEGQGTTVGADNSSEGISVYGEVKRAGIFEIKVSDEVFLEAGQTVKVKSAWRGMADPKSERRRISTAEDLQAADKTVQDITPPTALTAANLDSGILYNGNLTTRTKVIKGTAQEVGAAVHIYQNNTLWVSGTVGEDGTWSITLPESPAENDRIAIALNDNVPNATNLTAKDLEKLKDNGIFTNSGNENPSLDYTFHDAVFTGRLELAVIYYGALELVVSPVISYGSNAISPSEKAYPAGTMKLEVEDSRVDRKNWKLTAQLTSPFTLDGGSDELDIDLVYSYNGTESVIDANAVTIWSHTNTSDSFNIYDQWTIGGSGNGLFVKASSGNLRTGSYTAVVKWTLSDVP